MATGEVRKCPDCSVVMYPIRLIDKIQDGARTDLEYSLPEAKRSFWMGR